MLPVRLFLMAMLAILAVAAFAGCGSDNSPPPTYTPTQAVAASPVMKAADLAAAFTYPNAAITSVTTVAAGTMETTGNGGQTLPVPEYVKVLGKMNQRVSPVDGKNYAIGFEMRLPTNWNGRFFYQGNGGTDGNVNPASGSILGAGMASSGLIKGFAVISSDAGHALDVTTPIGGGVFGIDPQARLDYGYNAVATLTPMAKALIKTYYGKGPDKSYIVGGSNGGRHVMVAAARFGDQYDGFLASSPGFNLPKAAVAQLWGVQQLATISTVNATTGRPDITTSFSAADLKLVSDKIIAKCDALDGVADNMVSDVKACQAVFNIFTDVPTCTGAPDGTCLTYGQKPVLARMHAGAKDNSGNSLYVNFLWSEGIMSSGWRSWKYVNSTGPRDPLAVGFIFMTPPVSPTVLTGTGTTLLDFALNYNGQGFSVDTDAPKIFATNSTYTESSMSFMTPPNMTELPKMVGNHGKMIVIHGTADPVFSAQDTMNWYDGFRTRYGSGASSMARLFLVPGGGHVSGGPATDQYDMMDALVNWVEKGVAPDAVVAKARGAGSAVVNPEVPATWSPGRTRPLCAYPEIAKYTGSGDIENAANFTCVAP